MSDLDTHPELSESAAPGAHGPENLLLTARKVWLGKTTQVSRALPDHRIRMIGAWCFLDHYGPEDVSGTAGMQVWAHPHTGLQTVSWLFEGEIDHRDSVGSVAPIRPGELNIMTAGHGIAHSELSPVRRPPIMHGVQLWVALPEESRNTEPRFDVYHDLPDLDLPGATAKVLAGTIGGVTAPTQTFSPLSAADITVQPGARIEVSIDPAFEYGVFVVSGTVEIGSLTAEVDQLGYLGLGRSRLRLSSTGGARVVVLGGEPFAEEIVMWWNFVGRSHDEVVGYRNDWANRRELRSQGVSRFPAVVSDDERVMEAPPMPTVQLKPRPRRRD